MPMQFLRGWRAFIVKSYFFPLFHAHDFANQKHETNIKSKAERQRASELKRGLITTLIHSASLLINYVVIKRLREANAINYDIVK
jgi:hypothetical protein